MTGQFRQSVFGRLGGYEDVNDAGRLGRDPAMRWSGSPTICYDTNAIWEISANMNKPG